MTVLPTVARPPSTAFMSIIEPSPITAPMLIVAFIIITALSPISTWSRIIAPGSMRALIPLNQASGLQNYDDRFLQRSQRCAYYSHQELS